MNATVTIISIWSKIDGLEGKLHGRDKNFQYDVQVKTCGTVEQTLEEAFCLTNQDDRPNGNRCCSTTSGDIMVLDGKHYLVEGCGYKLLTPSESEMIQKLTSRDTSFGYKWLQAQNLLMPKQFMIQVYFPSNWSDTQIEFWWLNQPWHGNHFFDLQRCSSRDGGLTPGMCFLNVVI